MATIDMVGQRFGRLTVIRRDGVWRNPDSPWMTRAKWLCRCDCGNEVSVIGQNLRSGATRSCGCLRTELFVERTHERKRRRDIAQAMLTKG